MLTKLFKEFKQFGEIQQSEDELLQLIEEIGDLALQYNVTYFGCCQSVLAALQEKLNLKDSSVLKTSSALGGGVARRGETCGALIGSIMAICQIVGRESMEDKEQYGKAYIPAGDMYLRFREEVGDSICTEIQKILYGREYKLYDEGDRQAFHAVGGHEPQGCPGVCKKAAKIAARIILELKTQSG